MHSKEVLHKPIKGIKELIGDHSLFPQFGNISEFEIVNQESMQDQ